MQLTGRRKRKYVIFGLLKGYEGVVKIRDPPFILGSLFLASKSLGKSVSGPMLTFAVRFPALAISLCWMLYLAIDLNLRPARYDRNVKLLVLISLTTVVGTLTGCSVLVLDRIRPLKYDLYLYRADGLLGFEPSFVLGRLMRSSVSFRVVIATSYRVLLTVITVVLADKLNSGSLRDFVITVKTFLLDAYLATIFYLTIPIAGPGHVFASFPERVQASGMYPLLVHAPPNGMPSVHMSSALLIVYFCWHKKYGRWLSILFAVLTAVATLATGEHYFVDLLAALPYTPVILWLSGAIRSLPIRSRSLAEVMDEDALVVN